MHGLDSRLLRGLYCVVLVMGSRTVLGQQSEPAQNPPGGAAQSSLPEAPSPKTGTTAQTVPADQQQTKRIMGMLPNFRSVSAGEVVPKETARQKLVTATEDNFDYTSLFFAGFIAADSFASKSTPEFHQGAAGFARYYWHTVADQAVENYFVELIVPAIAHQDSRYYAMGKGGGGVWKRAGYSLSRVLVTRTDAGKRAFNISEVVGSAAAVSVSTFYYPSQERTPMNGLRNWGLDITYDSVTFVFHEFWPDIHSAVFKRKSAQVPAAGPVKAD
jgi:hypothetical protein